MTNKKIHQCVLFLTLILALNLSALSQTVDNKSIQIQLSQPDPSIPKLRVMISNPEMKKLSLSVANAENGYLNNKMMSDATFAVNYDFSNAEDGEYSFEVTSGKERILRQISIHTEVQVSRLVTLQPLKEKAKLGF